MVKIDIWNEDCIPGMEAHLANESVDHCVSSIPFGSLFSYSHRTEDIGNNLDGVNVHEGQFGLHVRFFIEQLFRVMKPGSVTAIHVQQLLRWKTQHGFQGMRDFRGSVITLFENHGFQPHGEVAIVKNPQALRNGSKVLTPAGWYPIEQLRIGDNVIGASGESTKVIGVYPQGKRPLFKITLSDGAEITCDGQHLWSVYRYGKNLQEGRLTTITTDEIRKEGCLSPSGRPRFYIPILQAPAQFVVNEPLPLDPYLIGALIGDGSLKHRRLSLTKDEEVITECVLPKGHYWEAQPNTDRANGTVKTWTLKSPDGRNNEAIRSLKTLGLYDTVANNKFIPDAYKYGSVKDRWRLLQGLLDTDGTVKVNPNNNAIQIKFSTISQRLASDFRFLVESLGGLASGEEIEGSRYKYNGENRQGQNIWAINVQLPQNKCPFILPRKANRWQPRKYQLRRFITAITEADTDECTCIQVEAADRLYVTERCIITHNSVARRLNLHSLMFATAHRDCRALAPAMNDYVLFFRKPGEGQALHGLIETNRKIKLVEPSPILEYLHDSGFNGPAAKRVRADYQTIPYQIETWEEKTGITKVKTVTGGKHINPDGWFTKLDWIRWAHGCWADIQEIDTLEGYKKCKENQEERHVCPLQLEVIRRCIKLYSAPGDTVLDPFMGIGSTAYVAVEQGRHCLGFELKESYHKFTLNNVKMAREKFEKPQNGRTQPLFQFECSTPGAFGADLF